ncbi:DNA mismatch repair protein MutS [Vararia minispora EC-137]|uniref:DNA mismatch repair protein MutS n=1 Tax=Vararia minispora EC-137 TaxID=1314806 RepID=A0ACB8QHK6_9AGAM|nr:DNA mismatch repair protein MutS [Vararia minispora EC-137]
MFKVRWVYSRCRQPWNDQVLSGRMGCSYYDPVKCIIYVLEDTREGVHFDLTRLLLEQASPDVVLISAQADDEFLDVCRAYTEASHGTLQLRPHKDFRSIRGRHSLLSLGLLNELPEPADAREPAPDAPFEPQNAYEFMRYRVDEHGDPNLRRWNASIRMSNFAAIDSAPLALGCIGAMLDYLSRERAIGELEDEGVGSLQVRGIEALALDQYMQINADALFSLQVFESESHASMHSDKTKEGLSLFSILNNTKTSLGLSLLRTWLLRPSMSINVITNRHEAVSCFIRPENIEVAAAMHNHLKGIKNMPRILVSIRAGKASLSDWQGLVKFSFHSVMLRDKLSELSQASDVEIVQKLCGSLDTASFREVGMIVNGTIDWEDSTTAGRICIRPHVDEELDNRKHVYNGIDTVLSRVAEEISTAVPPDYVATLNVVYFPQLGYLVCVPMSEEWRGKDGIQVLEGWTFQVSPESHVYFKNDKMHDLDKHLGDLYPSIVDRELEIIQVVQEGVMRYAEAMSTACDICAELDCLLCFAEASNAFGYQRPQMSEDSVLVVKAGRHPLQEQVVGTFVPNDMKLIGAAFDGNLSLLQESEDIEDDGIFSANSILICTGANACGKSIYLKQVSHIAFFTFVPAESAILGIVDKIFTRVQTRESVSRIQSSFMIDLNQVSLAIRSSTSRSLILLDEFGKGTLPAGSYSISHSHGAGLFCGVLLSLLARGPDCPMVLATTHFHEIFRTNFMDPRKLNITFVHMEVMFTNTAGEILVGDCSSDKGTNSHCTKIGDTITYLYRVSGGLSLHSHAGRCAELCGIPHHIVQRAKYVSQLLAAREIPRLLDEAMTDQQWREMQEAEQVCRRFLGWDLARKDTDATIEEIRQRLRNLLDQEVDVREQR